MNCTFDLVRVHIAVSKTKNVGSGKPCKCADSPESLLSASTKYGYTDADSDQN